jgi:hypothetical protein
MAQHLNDDIELVRCTGRLGFDGIVEGSHYGAAPVQSLRQVPFSLIALRSRRVCNWPRST